MFRFRDSCQSLACLLVHVSEPSGALFAWPKPTRSVESAPANSILFRPTLSRVQRGRGIPKQLVEFGLSCPWKPDIPELGVTLRVLAPNANVLILSFPNESHFCVRATFDQIEIKGLLT